MSNIHPFLRRLPPGPQSATMSACEVLTWIGMGAAQTWEDLNNATRLRSDRWMTSELGPVETALAARAAPYPSCAISLVRPYWNPEEDQTPRYTDRMLSPRGPRQLRLISGKFRRQEGRVVSFREMLAALRADLLENWRDDRGIKNAATQIMEALRAGRLIAYGQPSFENGAPKRTLPHEVVPLGVLMHPITTIDIRNEITAEVNDDVATWVARKGLTYHDVRFQTAAVLALWPEEPPPPMVTLDQLPAAWTLLECLAWIMLRDPAVVRDTAPETARAGVEYEVEHRLPDGRTAMTPQTGAGGNSIIRLDLLVARERDRDPAADVCASTVAEEALLAPLRAGTITASASPHPMTPADWRGLRLSDDGQHPERTSDRAQPWSAVTIDRTALLAIWSARAASAAAVPPAAPMDPIATARAVMLAYAAEVVAKNGKPPKRADAADHTARETGLAIRDMLQLYRDLPDHLRNAAPAAGVKRTKPK